LHNAGIASCFTRIWGKATPWIVSLLDVSSRNEVSKDQNWCV
jgi:hypothetical protein